MSSLCSARGGVFSPPSSNTRRLSMLERASRLASDSPLLTWRTRCHSPVRNQMQREFRVCGLSVFTSADASTWALGVVRCSAHRPATGCAVIARCARAEVARRQCVDAPWSRTMRLNHMQPSCTCNTGCAVRRRFSPLTKARVATGLGLAASARLWHAICSGREL
jgi:hypothetical protein